MKKRGFRFGQRYLKTCKFGIAMIQGERWYWLTDGYTRWLVEDFDAKAEQVKVRVWTRG